jgi:2-methylcitrate dehydratase PrpD
MIMVEEQTSAVNRLAAFAAGMRFEELPQAVRQRVPLMLTDLFGVTAAGARTSDMTELMGRWPCDPGDAPVMGTNLTTTPETAAYLNAISACCLELDEGNKHARGHPAVHVVFAAVAATQRAGKPISGEEFLTAIVAGYEVAARFGRAVRLDPGWHPHGHWGAAGAACAAALIHGCSVEEIAASIDAATGLIHVTPWDMVLNGNFTRNLWAAGANTAGLNAVHLARAGIVSNSGAAARTLGQLAGTLDADLLTEQLGEFWLSAHGYSKWHASCSYTHVAIDIVQRLKREHLFDVEDIASVTVRTHSLAEPLFAGTATNRLSAMFSFPFVVAAALVNDAVSPGSMDPHSDSFKAATRILPRITTMLDPVFDAALPSERWAEVEIRFENGTVVSKAQPNPRGDADYYPFRPEDIEAKLVALIGPSGCARVVEVVSELPTSINTQMTLRKLSGAASPTAELEPNDD